MRFGLQPQLLAGSDGGGVPPHEQHLSDQLDRLRDGAKSADPEANLRLFQGFLDSLPADASAVIRFRAKANVGLQHLARGQTAEAMRWLSEACDEAPDDPRAVANRALVLWMGGDAEGAYRFGRDRLAADPSNDTLASYLPQFAVAVPDVVDGLDGIPILLRETESVVLGQAVFLRGRDARPTWWEWVRSAAVRFPASSNIRLMEASSHVDEISRDDEVQRTQMLRGEQRERLVSAVAVLDAELRDRPWLLRDARDDGSYTLNCAMVAHRLLHDREAALSCAKRILDEGLSDPPMLLNAVMVSQGLGRPDLAKRLIALAPDDADLAFHAGVLAVQEDDWEGVTLQFGKARTPDGERRVVEVALALAPLMLRGRSADGSAAQPAAMEALADSVRDTPRGLVLIAHAASRLGLSQLSERAFEAAVIAVPDGSDLATRLMVAGYAERAGSPATVIRLLDGHLPSDGLEREHERLAIAHANERPHRPRNLAYFRSLPDVLRRSHRIARAHASTLMDVGEVPQALALLRRLHAEDPSDAFVTLRLVEALHRSGDVAGEGSILRRLDLAASKGAPAHVMALAQSVRRRGEVERAYEAAYDLVRRNADDADVVLGYLGLGLLVQEPIPLFEASVAGIGTWVSIRGPDGTQKGFVIDEGGDFFGITVLAPTSGIAARVLGRRRGDTIALPKLGAAPETWTVTEVVSKYLHLHHHVMEEFETRFPDTPGIARFTVGEGDIGAVLDVVRRSADQNARIARSYAETPIPLAIAARVAGGDVVSFARYVQVLGGDIFACHGAGEERVDAMRRARRSRGSGGVLDPYTAFIAAEVGALPALSAWFGALRTPSSTMTMIDRMVAREEDGRGREQMTVSWHDGAFYRTEVRDAHRDAQITALNRVRADLVAHVEVVPVLVPDDASRFAETVIGFGGGHVLDAAFLAAETGTMLLSDDMRYREVAKAAVACDGVWMQSVLLAAALDRQLPAEDYARAVVGLAERGHDHVALNGQVLYLIAREDGEGLPGLRAALRFIGGPKAEVHSHREVFQGFLDLLWDLDNPMPHLTIRSATGFGLAAFVTRRPHDGLSLLAGVIRRSMGNPPLLQYLRSWCQGHAVTSDMFAPPTKASRRRRRRGLA